jgi:hypothetical protein
MEQQFDLNDLRNKVLANKSARERGEAPPFEISPEILHAAIQALPNTRKEALEVRAKKAGTETKAEKKKADDALDAF